MGVLTAYEAVYHRKICRINCWPDGCTDPEAKKGMQFNGGEDPATGSAAGCAISYLVRRGAAPSAETIRVRQGVEIGRASDLFLSARRVDEGVSEVRVGGSTVSVAVGRFFLR